MLVLVFYLPSIIYLLANCSGYRYRVVVGYYIGYCMVDALDCKVFKTVFKIFCISIFQRQMNLCPLVDG